MGKDAALNLAFRVMIKFHNDCGSITHIEMLPTLAPGERIFLPLDPYPNRKKYTIEAVEVECESVVGEFIRIERNKTGPQELATDHYYTRTCKDAAWSAMYEIKGTTSEWLFVD